MKDYPKLCCDTNGMVISIPEFSNILQVHPLYLQKYNLNTAVIRTLRHQVIKEIYDSDYS